MIKGFVFDLDGVVVDSHPAHRRAWVDFLHMLGRKASDKDLDFILEGRKREDILRHFLGDLSAAELDHYGKKKDEFFQRIADHVPPVAGVMDFLAEIANSGLACALATSASRRRTELTLKTLKLEGHFQAVVTGEDVKAGKPDPAIYAQAAAELKIPPQFLVAFEDAPAGVQAATRAGLKCVGVATEDKVDRLLSAGAASVIPDFVSLHIAKVINDPALSATAFSAKEVVTTA